MKVLLTGGNGQLGKSIIKAKPKNISLISPSKSELDLENEEKIIQIIESERPDWIINSGAYTNVDKAEIEKDKAIRVNYTAPKIQSKAISEKKIKLFQISTDYVFDGKKNKPYLVTDETNPNNLYGESKASAEAFIKNYLVEKNKYIILRTSWVVSPYGKNFVRTILNLLRNKENINVVCDQIGSLTSTYFLSTICWKLIQENEQYTSVHKNFPPIHHWCDEGIISWYDVACAIKNKSKEIGLLNNSATVSSITSEEYKFVANRPKYSVLDCSMTENLLNIKRVNWQNSLLKILQSIQINENDCKINKTL